MAKKMLLVDPKVMEQLKQPLPSPNQNPLPDVLTDTLMDLDREMKDVLNQTGISMHDKASAYQQILHRFLTLGEQYQERSRPSTQPLLLPPPPPPPPSPEPSSSSSSPPASASASASPANYTPSGLTQQNWKYLKNTVVESVPYAHRKRAKQLLKHMERIEDLTWTPRGEMIYDGQKIPSSHIVDLVGDMMRHRKRAPDPAGWEVFASALKQSNVPKDFIGHEGRRQWMERVRTAALSSSPPLMSSSLMQQEEDEEDTTPRTLLTSVLDTSEAQSPTPTTTTTTPTISWMHYK